MFGYQRTAFEQTQTAALETVKLQRTAAQQFAAALETGKQLQTRGNELKRTTLHASLDAIEQTTPETDLAGFHEIVDEGIDILEAGYEQNWEAAIEGIEEFEAATDSYSETVDDSFDSFLAAQAQIEDTTATVVEDVESAVSDEVAAD
jgi:hypothetical protein